MTKNVNIRTLIATAALSAAFASGSTAAFADDRSRIGTMKPHHALAFAISGKPAVSYFLAEGQTCHLVLTIAEEPNLLEHSRYVATRFEADVQAGESTRYKDGLQAFDFACQSGATAMSVTASGTITLGSNEK